MVPGIFNIGLLYRGDTFNGFPVQFLDINSNPISLNRADVLMQIRFGCDDGVVLKEFSLGSGLTEIDLVNGEFMVDAFNVDLPIGESVYDIQVTFSPASIRTFLRGSLLVTSDVSKEI